MPAAAPEFAARLTRRGLAASLLVVSVLAIAPAAVAPAAAQQSPPILVVSHKSVLNDTDQARALLQAENELTVTLQSRVDAVKSELEAEEKELADLRATLPRNEFDARVADFDRKVRGQRRDMLSRGAALRNAFRDQRLKLLDALGPILAQVRAGHGASAVLNADDLLDYDPALDVTAEVIALFNREVPAPEIPDLETIEDSVTTAPGLR